MAIKNVNTLITLISASGKHRFAVGMLIEYVERTVSGFQYLFYNIVVNSTLFENKYMVRQLFE